MEEENKIDFFEPGTIIFFIMAFLADLSLLGLLGIAIVPVGLVIAAFVLMAHWGVGLIIVFYFWGKNRGLLPKAILILFWILPLPLTVGLILMIVSSSKVGEIVVEQVAIQAVAALTAGGGEALEVGAVAAEGAEVAATAAESAEAVETAAEGAEAVGEATGAASGGAAEAGAETGAGTEGVETAERGRDEMAAREERNPMENLQEELEEPQEGEEAETTHDEDEEENKATKRLKKVFDIANRNSNAPQGNERDQEEESENDDIQKAA